MKQVDLTKSVMRKVVSFERKRVKWWLTRFFAVLIGLLSTLLAFLWLFQQALVERSVFDLFTLMTEDREIIEQFWQDTLGVIWEELPHRLLFLLLIIFIIIIIFIIRSRKKLTVVKTKVRQLAKYKNSD